MSSVKENIAVNSRDLAAMIIKEEEYLEEASLSAVENLRDDDDQLLWPERREDCFNRELLKKTVFYKQENQNGKSCCSR